MIDSAHSIGHLAAPLNKADVKLARELLDGEIWEFGGDERCGWEVQTYVRDYWVYRACDEFW
ncbi:hypothetical protein BDY24DRAFT_413378 [Mrakia frigida]|uniref:uncharacterized protein n=1 Tax=Mrakia frigida TaxID=29902 RepID=UPI003FCC1B71